MTGPCNNSANEALRFTCVSRNRWFLAEKIDDLNRSRLNMYLSLLALFLALLFSFGVFRLKLDLCLLQGLLLALSSCLVFRAVGLQ
jgi:hypothetical protein